MQCKEKRKKRRDVLTIIGMMIMTNFILRMWPILLLMMIGVFFYALWMLFHMENQPVQVEPPPLLALPEPASEESMLNMAFAVLQRKITEQVLVQYPEARWVWGVPDARERFAHGGALNIMLNRAGGYRKAEVLVNNLQFCGLHYPSAEQRQQPEPAPDQGPDQAPDAEPKEDPEQEPDEVDYGLLAFEWVEANLQALNAQCNEVIGCGDDSFRIPASKLPHGDSWPLICQELLRNGFTAAEPLADGIQVQIKVK